MNRQLIDRRRCPLCTERYDCRSELRVHLEVQHRKSEIVSRLLDHELESDFEGGNERESESENDSERARRRDESVTVDGDPAPTSV
ncbi:hypothetical protein [Halobiforma nitratireducens]|uniref:C2H2-type domain-containing protein n=1 Tax=Halobiforma nitratireducens JCM 10879 TaxID=1227454 RepID=M0MNB1_9EURY|nr:hypothetical protein [Halobiforma nitratireducens]EMA46229.1 hypothetical protein C446_01683 [Halobiforma nitratireducens JCM 10879]